VRVFLEVDGVKRPGMSGNSERGELASFYS
jgi:hypothetical protein